MLFLEIHLCFLSGFSCFNLFDLLVEKGKSQILDAQLLFSRVNCYKYSCSEKVYLQPVTPKISINFSNIMKMNNHEQNGNSLTVLVTSGNKYCLKTNISFYRWWPNNPRKTASSVLESHAKFFIQRCRKSKPGIFSIM